jgi:hypothetical protein
MLNGIEADIDLAGSEACLAVAEAKAKIRREIRNVG